MSSLPSERVMVALAFGQSNAANSGSVRGHAGEHVYNFYQGNLYEAQDPMLGATRDGGSVWTRLGRKLIASGEYDAVVFVTIGFGGSEVARWTPGGDLHPRLLGAIRDLKNQGLTPTHLLWHQGEADNRLGTGKEAYTEHFLRMLGSIREQGINAPIYVSTATRYRYKGPNEQLRQAQTELVDAARGIWAGPDTDDLGEVYRYDGTHFNGAGLGAFADLWLEKLDVAGSAPAPEPSTDRYLMNFEETLTDRLIYGVTTGSGVVYQAGSNPKASTIPVVGQRRWGRRILRARQAKVAELYGSKRLTVVSPRSNTPSPQGGRIRLRFTPLNPAGVKLTSVTLSNVTTQGAYLRFFYVGGGSSLQRLGTTAPGDSLEVSLDISRVRAVDIVARNAFAVDDVAFTDQTN